MTSIILFLIGIQFLQKADAQVPFSILITSNSRATDTILRNEPLLLKIVLVNKQAQSAAGWNDAAERRLKELDGLWQEKKISDSIYQKEKADIRSQLRFPGVTRLGSSREPWTGKVNWSIRSANNTGNFSWPLKLLSNPESADEAVLDEHAYYAAYFGIDPELMNGISTGDYVIQASINGLQSKSLHLRIDNSLIARRDTISHLLMLGNYFWHTGNAAKMLDCAEKVLISQPRSMSGLVMKADALVLQRSLLPALDIYNLALTEYYNRAGNNAEPPDYILGMISAIKKELGGN